MTCFWAAKAKRNKCEDEKATMASPQVYTIFIFFPFKQYSNAQLPLQPTEYKWTHIKSTQIWCEIQKWRLKAASLAFFGGRRPFVISCRSQCWRSALLRSKRSLCMELESRCFTEPIARGFAPLLGGESHLARGTRRTARYRQQLWPQKVGKTRDPPHHSTSHGRVTAQWNLSNLRLLRPSNLGKLCLRRVAGFSRKSARGRSPGFARGADRPDGCTVMTFGGPLPGMSISSNVRSQVQVILLMLRSNLSSLDITWWVLCQWARNTVSWLFNSRSGNEAIFCDGDVYNWNSCALILDLAHERVLPKIYIEPLAEVWIFEGYSCTVSVYHSPSGVYLLGFWFLLLTIPFPLSPKFLFIPRVSTYLC